MQNSPQNSPHLNRILKYITLEEEFMAYTECVIMEILMMSSRGMPYTNLTKGVLNSYFKEKKHPTEAAIGIMTLLSYEFSQEKLITWDEDDNEDDN